MLRELWREFCRSFWTHKPKGPSRTVFSTESDSVVFYYSVVNLLRIVMHYSKSSKAVQNEVIHYIFSSEPLRVINSLYAYRFLVCRGPLGNEGSELSGKFRSIFRAALKGTNLRGQTPICTLLWVPVVCCGFLRKSVLPNCFVFRKRRESAKNLRESAKICGLSL